jgi:lipoate-protein ligase A
MHWRFVDSGALDGAEHMSIDAGLLDRARGTGEAVLRVYSWRRATLSFGRHESVRGRFLSASLQAAGVDAVRRPTGGRVLIHDREVTYSVTAPTQEGESLHASYRGINAILLSALGRLGVQAAEAPRGPPLRPGDSGAFACFATPSAGELVVGDRKLVGSAQVRERGALLQHGSILVDDDQPRIAALASVPVTPPPPAATLHDCLGRRPSYEEVRDALFAALVASAPGATPLPADEARSHAGRHRAQFTSPEWTWRR